MAVGALRNLAVRLVRGVMNLWLVFLLASGCLSIGIAIGLRIGEAQLRRELKWLKNLGLRD